VEKDAVRIFKEVQDVSTGIVINESVFSGRRCGKGYLGPRENRETDSNVVYEIPDRGLTGKGPENNDF
jgi:hypothetical protein